MPKRQVSGRVVNSSRPSSFALGDALMQAARSGPRPSEWPRPARPPTVLGGPRPPAPAMMPIGRPVPAVMPRPVPSAPPIERRQAAAGEPSQRIRPAQPAMGISALRIGRAPLQPLQLQLPEPIMLQNLEECPCETCSANWEQKYGNLS